MGYSVIIYHKTGFTATNIPDSPETLAAAASSYEPLPDLEILQCEWLASVTLKCNRETILDVDYIKIGTWYYYIDTFTMQNKKAATVSLTPIFILIGGGISKIKFISGLITRISPKDMTAWANGVFRDEYMLPGDSPDVYTGAFGPKYEDGATSFIAAQADLGAQGHIDGFQLTTTDADGNATTGGQIYYKTITRITEPDIYVRPGVKVNLAQPYNLYAGIGQNFIIDGINNLRSIGAEGAVVACYAIPDPWFGMETKGLTINEEDYPGAIWKGESPATYNYVSKLTAITYEATLEDILENSYGEYIENQLEQCTNKDILKFSPYTKYGILTATGDRVEFEPQDIINIHDESSPNMLGVADLRYDGHAYYGFNQWAQEKVNAASDKFFMRSVSGPQWKNVPLLWTDVSGGKILQANYNMSRAKSDLEYDQQTRGFINQAILGAGDALGASGSGDEATLLSGISGLGSAIHFLGAANAGLGEAGIAMSAGTAAAAGGAAGGLSAGGVGGLGAAAATAGIGAAAIPVGAAIAVGAGALALGASKYKKLNAIRESYNLEKANELSQYMTASQVSIPTVGFPYEANIFREMIGDGVIYFYGYSFSDLRRIDQILTAYGWKTSILATGDASRILNTHEKFNYIEGSVEVEKKNGSFPKWLADGIAAEISGGVRIWHTKPIPITADCNPVVTTEG